MDYSASLCAIKDCYITLVIAHTLLLYIMNYYLMLIDSPMEKISRFCKFNFFT